MAHTNNTKQHQSAPLAADGDNYRTSFRADADMTRRLEEYRAVRRGRWSIGDVIYEALDRYLEQEMAAARGEKPVSRANRGGDTAQSMSALDGDTLVRLLQGENGGPSPAFQNLVEKAIAGAKGKEAASRLFPAKNWDLDEAKAYLEFPGQAGAISRTLRLVDVRNRLDAVEKEVGISEDDMDDFVPAAKPKIAGN